MQSVSLFIYKYIFYYHSCKGTGYIPASYKPCPRCGGQGQGVLKDCRLCDDLCYVTEPWIQCQVCLGKGKQGNMGVLSLDCTACKGIGFTKPGLGFGPQPGVFAPHHMGAPHHIIPPHGGYGPHFNPGYGAYPHY